MLVVKSKRYIKKHVVGGAGMFDTITGVIKRLTPFITRAAASDIGKHAINAAKTVGKELASSAISTAKDIAIEKGKQLIDKTASLAKAKPVLTQKSKDILESLVNNARMTTGQGLNNAIRIQDLVRKLAGEAVFKLNGGGLRLA